MTYQTHLIILLLQRFYITYPIAELKIHWLNKVISVLILRCESVVILLSAVISKVINLTSVINSYFFGLYMKQKDTVWLLYSALDEKKTIYVRCLDCNAEVSA